MPSQSDSIVSFLENMDTLGETTSSMIEQLDEEISDSSDESEEEPNAPDENKENWVLDQLFESQQQIDDFLKNEKCWSYRTTYRTKDGQKTLYRCNVAKRLGPQCDAQIYTLEKPLISDSSENEAEEIQLQRFKLYRKMTEHTHENLNKKNKNKKVSEEVKNKILDLHKNGKKPRAIAYAIRDDQSIPADNQPTKKQIRPILSNFSQIEYGKKPLTMRSLTDFVTSHLKIPDDIG